jgi:hypothetical protein
MDRWMDGKKFFSKSPFRSGYFIIATLVCAACMVLFAYTIYNYWSRLWQFEVLILFQVAWGGVAATWWRVFRYISRVRELFDGDLSETLEPSSPLNVVMNVAASAINELMFFLYGSICLLVVYIISLLNHTHR